MVARLLVHVEGETEETFVNEILRQHLVTQGYERVDARLLGNARLRSHRGGSRAWVAVRKDIVRHLSQDPHCIATTMVDYYGLPASGGHAWPGRAAATDRPFPENSLLLENALLADIEQVIGAPLEKRFVPYIVMHEFEALLFSDCAVFASSLGRPELESSLQNIRDQFETPEEIDDSPVTAPSKRIAALVSGYQKPLFGNLAALEIGLAKIRNACPHFGAWISKLEALGR